MKPGDLNFCKPDRRRSRPKYFFVGAFVLFLGFLAWVQSGHVNEVTVINDSLETAAPEFSPPPTLAEKIKEGVAMLEKSEPLKYETRNKNLAGELIRKQIALAVLNKNTGEVFEQRSWVRENEIKNYRQTGTLDIENTSDLKIAVAWWNSFNTDYFFPDNPEMVVVANKYLWPSSNLATLPERSKNSPPHQTATSDCVAGKQKWPFWCGGKYTEIIYAPYSGGLHVPELVEAGKKYMEENISIAFGQLENARVESRFIKSRIVTEGINEDFIKNIILVEHVDPDAFRTADDGGRMLVERVLVIIGANKEKAFRYTGSSAGASGLAQFIRPTYQNIISKYPKARMIKDYNLGMANHVNAIKAMVLFFDEHKKALASKITRKDIVKPLGITEEMLAAAYNGGPTRVSRSINKFGLAWIGSQLRLPSSQKILRSETLNYIEKFRSIKSLDIF